MKKFLPANQKEMYERVASCFSKTSFEQLLDTFCVITNEERFELVAVHMSCFLNKDMESFGVPTINMEQYTDCVAEYNSIIKN